MKRICDGQSCWMVSNLKKYEFKYLSNILNEKEIDAECSMKQSDAIRPLVNAKGTKSRGH